MIATAGIRVGLQHGLARAALLLLAVVASGCGGGGTPPPATGAPPAPSGQALPPESAAFCTAAVDLARVVNDGPDIDDPPGPPEAVASAFKDYAARLEPPLRDIEQTVPPVAQQDIATIARQARYAVATNDEAPLETPEYVDAVARLRTVMIAQCGFRQVRVTAVEHQFQGIPPTLPAGTVAFTLANQGAQSHELDVYRIDEGVPQTFPEIVVLPDEQREAALTDVGRISTDPGHADTGFMTLVPGRYGVTCLVPEGSTPAAEGIGPPHATLGMVAEFTVS
jgi:hypothetical protein